MWVSLSLICNVAGSGKKKGLKSQFVGMKTLKSPQQISLYQCQHTVSSAYRTGDESLTLTCVRSFSQLYWIPLQVIGPGRGFHLALCFPKVLLAILSGNLGPILQLENHPVFFEHSTPYSLCVHQTGMGV